MDEAESSDHALIPAQWQPILHLSNQVVLYDASSRVLAVTSNPPTHPTYNVNVPTNAGGSHTICPLCHRPLDEEEDHEDLYNEIPSMSSRAQNYFHLLGTAHETHSRPTTPTPTHAYDDDTPISHMAQGYFDAFFREECKLGMGANGSVFLVRHVLEGHDLGRFALKKIAVGSSHEYLDNILREVRLLETLRHENIITYHHAWLESSRFSSFGPPVPALFVLMQWAEGGSLDDYILSRQGVAHGSTHEENPDEDSPSLTKAQRIAAFRERTRSGAHRSRAVNMKAVHLLNASEIHSLFGDIVAGLAFLHGRSILHLDLKPGNVLLTWDGDRLIPRAMLSDFGASRDMLKQASNPRTGITGTLEYTAPEMLMPQDPSRPNSFRQMDTKADIWSLGIILHKLIWFHTPYIHTDEDLEGLQEEVLEYRGFVTNQDLLAACLRRGLPASLFGLLESLLDTVSNRRPSAEKLFDMMRSEKPVQTFSTSRRPRRGSNATLRPNIVPAPSPTNALVHAPPPIPSPEGRVSPRVSAPHSPLPLIQDHRDTSEVAPSNLQTTFALTTDKKPGLITGDSFSARLSLARWVGQVVENVRQVSADKALHTLKACILVLKIATLALACEGVAPTSSIYRGILIILLAALSILDLPSSPDLQHARPHTISSFPSLAVSFTLAVAHVVGLWMLVNGRADGIPGSQGERTWDDGIVRIPV